MRKSRRKKTVTMLIEVSIVAIGAERARADIREIIRDGLKHDGAITLRSVKPAATVLADAAMARKAWGRAKHPAPRKRDGTPPLLAAMEGDR